jgi:transposase
MIYEHRGIDGNKKVNGRKRQLLVDVLGCIWNASVNAAHKYDGIGGLELLEDITEKMPGVKKIMGDKAYRGTFAAAVENRGLFFEVHDRPEGVKGIAIEAKRWVVERTFACLNFYRRVVMDYEHTT